MRLSRYLMKWHCRVDHLDNAISSNAPLGNTLFWQAHSMCLMPRQHCPRTRYLVSPELTGGEIRPEFRLFPSRARGGVFDLFYPFHHQPQAGGRGWRGGEGPPHGAGEAHAVGKPLPNPPQGEGEARAVESSQRLVVRVRRFRVISCRDAVSVLSKCAGWCSVTSVCSVFKK